MRFPRPEQFIDCSALIDFQSHDLAVTDVALTAASQLDRFGFVALQIGALRLDEKQSRDIAHTLMDELRSTLVALGAPGELKVEIDEAQRTPVPAEFGVPALLPHHDGQFSSYLTPSTLDVPDWGPEQRTFSDDGLVATHPHKLYRGIFVSAPGTGLSVTPYYDWIRILDDVRASRGDASVASTPAWLAANLRRCIAAGEKHALGYPTLAGMLGLTEEALVAVPLLRGEAPLPEVAVERFPDLRGLGAACACGRCNGPTARVFCHVVTLATGLSWPAFRRRYEILVPSERFDLVVGNNLTMLHGGSIDERDRVIEPVSLTLGRPEGTAYEQWLSRAWQRRAYAGSSTS